MVNPEIAKKAASAGSKPATKIAKNKNANLSRREQAGKALRNIDNYQTSSRSENSETDDELNYTGSDETSNATAQGGKKKKSKLNAKNLAKASPIIIFLGIILLIGALIVGVASLAPGAINANILTLSDDPQNSAVKAAAETISAAMLENGSLPSTFAQRLTDAGLEVGYFDKDGTFVAGLRPNPENSIALSSFEETSKPTDHSLVIRYGDDIITSKTFSSYIESNLGAYAAFAEATYGRAMNNFDETAQSFYSSIKSSRNIFANYTVTGNSATDMESFREAMTKHFENGTNTTAGMYDESDGTSSNSDKNPGYNTAVIAYLEELAKISAESGEQCPDNSNEECIESAAQFATLVNNAVNANETYQSMQFFLLIEEAISKMMAGESSSTPVNAVMNMLMSQTTDINGNTGSAMQSPALSAVMTKNYSSNLASESSAYSLDRVLQIASDQLIAIYGNHNLAATGSVSSSVLNALDDSAVSQRADQKTFIESYSYVVLAGAKDELTKTTSRIIAAITPSISQSILFNNAGETLSGIAAGEFFVKGASAFGNHMAQFTQGGTTGDATTISAYNNYSAHLAALDAAVDRQNRSPFDITSQNTFLGSIASNFSSYLLSSSSFSSTLTSLATLTNNSLISIVPGASAAGSTASYYTTYGSCPPLESIGVKGDVYCNPIIIFDIDALSTLINSNDFKNWLSGQLEPDGEYASTTKGMISSYKIKDGSTLSKFLSYNNGRSSTVGVQDASICNAIADTERSWIEKFFDWLGKLFSSSASENYASRAGCGGRGEVTGAAFANTTSNSDWSTYQYAQAYSCYVRFLDQIEYFSSDNTNTASLSQYFVPGTGKNVVNEYLADLTKSYENETDSEYLARISGITVSEADAVLGFFAYNSYLASIDYENRFAFSVETKPSEKIFVEPLKNTLDSLPTTLAFGRREEYHIS